MIEFKNCTIVIPVIRETDLFEQVVNIILDTCDIKDLAEFLIVISREYTAKESLTSIEKMKKITQERGVPYRVIEQKLPGMGGAMRDGLDEAKGTHTVILGADMATDPSLMPKLISNAKEFPCDIISVSRYVQGGDIGNDYKKTKRVWNGLSQKYLKILYQSKLTDFTLMYRICPTAYYHAVNWEETKHPFALETTLKFVRLKLNFHEIPGKQIGGSQSGYRETLLYLPTSLRIRFMRKSKILRQGLTLGDFKNISK